MQTPDTAADRSKDHSIRAPRLRLDQSPGPSPESVIQGDRYRITVLTDGLLRLEYAADGIFEDRASSFAIHRDLPTPAFRVVDEGPSLEIITERLHLVYDRGPFSASGLSVSVKGGITVYHSVWQYGVEPGDEDGTVAGMEALRGTARTLDEADGDVPLEGGIVSRTGFAVLDDSASMLFTDDGWIAPRRPAPAPGTPGGDRIDLYVFAYGHDYRGALRAFYDVSGPQPLLPRFALGSWWSRFYRYTADGYAELMDRFRTEGIPFSVSVIDMDWHVVDVDPALGSGWTGYSWNRSLFPDPAKFVTWLHEHGLRVTLNVHPADGVRAHEDAYAEMAAALGRDTSASDPIALDVTDPAFMAAYFEILHRRVEADGIDFWWVDWQSGPHSRIAGIDPLWVLNHFHFLDNARPRGLVGAEPGGAAAGQSARDDRPLTFSRYAGPGSHRYPVGFSGDSVISWKSLDFQPYFTASATNIGYGWWSHDIGGHMHGVKDDELATRWLQFGVLSPILRLHSGANAFITKEPWTFGPEARAVQTDWLRLRHRLVPYLHTMNHRARFDAIPVIEPLYYRWPTRGEAYAAKNEYFFGSELVVAPITTPADDESGTGSTHAWLPGGTWVDVLTGLVYDAGAAGREIVMHRGLASQPVLAPAGALVPLDAAVVPADEVAPPPALEVLVVVGADGAFDLVEDDGRDVAAPDAPNVVRTPIAWEQDAGRLSVGPAVGGEAGLDAIPARRAWTLTFPAIADLASDDGGVRATVDDRPVTAHVTRRPALVGSWGPSDALVVTVDDVPVGARLEVSLSSDDRGTVGLAPNGIAVRVFEVLDRAQIAFDLKEQVHGVVTSGAQPMTVVSRLQAMGLPRAIETAIGEVLLAQSGF